MPQKAVELILMRQLASYLATPILLFDPAGNLIFFNEPAEAFIGRRFDETGEIAMEDWSGMFDVLGENGSPLPLDARPLLIALHRQQAAHRALVVHSRDGRTMKVEATAFPMQGPGGRNLGAVVICWEEAQA